MASNPPQETDKLPYKTLGATNTTLKVTDPSAIMCFTDGQSDHPQGQGYQNAYQPNRPVYGTAGYRYEFPLWQYYI